MASIKVLWRNQKSEEATWEAKEDMKSKYPHLFSYSFELVMKVYDNLIDLIYVLIDNG